MVQVPPSVEESMLKVALKLAELVEVEEEDV